MKIDARLAVAALLLLATLGGSASAQDEPEEQAAFGPPAPVPGGLGTVAYIDHYAGEITINDRDYTFRPDQIRVTYLEDSTGRLVYIQEGAVVRFDLDQDGRIVHMNLVGPPNRIEEILNR